MVKIVKYDVHSDNFLAQYQNVNVLVGPKHNVDVILPIVDKFINGLGGSFERQDRTKGNWDT